MVLKDSNRRRGEPADARECCALLELTLEKMHGERRDVDGSLGERRDPYHLGGQPVPEITPEPPLLPERLRILVRRGDPSQIDGAFARPAKLQEGSPFEHVKELRLHLEGARFERVREERATVRRQQKPIA